MGGPEMAQDGDQEMRDAVPGAEVEDADLPKEKQKLRLVCAWWHARIGKTSTDALVATWIN
jgi:hypothetical protein